MSNGITSIPFGDIYCHFRAAHSQWSQYQQVANANPQWESVQFGRARHSVRAAIVVRTSGGQLLQLGQFIPILRRFVTNVYFHVPYMSFYVLNMSRQNGGQRIY
jgi:hypothetical protein